VAGTAAESIVVERERDTWSGLIATPLTGRDILRAKMLGILWKSRVLWIILLAMWIVGLLSGSVHPLGLLAAVVALGVWSWLLLSIGIYASLWGRDRNQTTGWALFPILVTMVLAFFPFAWPGMANILLGGLTMPFQMWESLLSYEDVRAALRGEVSSQLASVGIHDIAGLRIGLAVWMVEIVGQVVGAYLLSRAAYRGFDRAVGRPVR
jgi:hypothetical protein